MVSCGNKLQEKKNSQKNINGVSWCWQCRIQCFYALSFNARTSDTWARVGISPNAPNCPFHIIKSGYLGFYLLIPTTKTSRPLSPLHTPSHQYQTKTCSAVTGQDDTTQHSVVPHLSYPIISRLSYVCHCGMGMHEYIILLTCMGSRGIGCKRAWPREIENFPWTSRYVRKKKKKKKKSWSHIKKSAQKFSKISRNFLKILEGPVPPSVSSFFQQPRRCRQGLRNPGSSIYASRA